MTETKNNVEFNNNLRKAMCDMANPTKDSTAHVPTKSGKEYSYKYETLDQVLAIVKPALMKHGLALTQRETFRPETESYVLQTVVFDVKEERILDERPLPYGTDAQVLGSFETYMRRYALRTAFGLTGEDDDGAATRSLQTTPNYSKQSKPTKPTAEQIKRRERNEALTRMVNALSKWCEAHGADFDKAKEAIKERPDFADTAEFYNAAAKELESA